MSNNSGLPASIGPLTDLEVVSSVKLLQSVPQHFPEPFASVARQALAAAPNIRAIAKVYLAVWPGGTSAMLAHNPDWPKPRPEQLVRAYLAARALRTPVGARSAS